MSSTNNQTSQLEPAVLVIFGITGDLAKRKVLPALYHLFKDGLLPEHTYIVGTSRQNLSATDLLKQVELCVLEADGDCDPAVLAKMQGLLSMVQLDPVVSADYEKLHGHLQQVEDAAGICLNRLFYLSIPPGVYQALVSELGQHRLNASCKHNVAESRLLVEKPFGYDLASARELIAETSHSFQEAQVFRIDHYLAKETVQNILTFRKHNPIFEHLWNAKHITRISVVAYEKIGIEGRANFYEGIGALRDLVQSHLLQLLALTTMELPADTTDSAAIHAVKQKLLAQITPIPANEVAHRARRAQYEGYTDEVAKQESSTETFAELMLSIDNPTWKGVAISIATGKAMSEKRTAIAIEFGNASHGNRLTFRLQPDEGIDIDLQVKKPGFAHELQSVRMDFSYGADFAHHPDAYERVLVDAIRGDHTLFATAEEVISSWRVLQAVLDEWSKDDAPLKRYKPGSSPQAIWGGHDS